MNKLVFREYCCLHNPKSYNNTCNDEGGNYCPQKGCHRACIEIDIDDNNGMKDQLLPREERDD